MKIIEGTSASDYLFGSDSDDYLFGKDIPETTLYPGDRGTI